MNVSVRASFKRENQRSLLQHTTLYRVCFIVLELAKFDSFKVVTINLNLSHESCFLSSYAPYLFYAIFKDKPCHSRKVLFSSLFTRYELATDDVVFFVDKLILEVSPQWQLDLREAELFVLAHKVCDLQRPNPSEGRKQP